MNVQLPGGRLRLAFLGPPETAIHVPQPCDWAEARFFEAPKAASWVAALEEATQWRPDASILFGPPKASAGDLAHLPGLRIAILLRPLFPISQGRSLLDLCQGPHAIQWCTYPLPEVPEHLRDLPILQTQPPPLNLARFSPPRLDRRQVLAVEWALPPAQILKEVKSRAPMTILPASATDGEVVESLRSHDILLYWGAGPLGLFDVRPLEALAAGLLLISSTAFPPAWGIELEDEYLHRPTGDRFVAALDDAIRLPQPLRSVRVRAWQKIRETLDANQTYQRILHDALAFASRRRLPLSPGTPGATTGLPS